MKKILTILLLASTQLVWAQKYMTKTGSIDFLSKAPIETIEGKNKAVAALLNTQTSSLDFIVQVKSFIFEKQLMQEHFNENYMESEKYPKATFKGVIEDLSKLNLAKDGEYNVVSSGKLTIHGVSKDVKYPGKLVVKGGKITLQSAFGVLLSDYKIAIPGAVKDKISKEIKINLNCTLDPIK